MISGIIWVDNIKAAMMSMIGYWLPRYYRPIITNIYPLLLRLGSFQGETILVPRAPILDCFGQRHKNSCACENNVLNTLGLSVRAS